MREDELREMMADIIAPPPDEGDLPWVGEPDTDRFEASGLRCVVTRMKRKYAGNLNGYVGVKTSHPLYGIKYSAPLPSSFLLERRLKGTYDPDRLSFGLLMSVMCGSRADEIIPSAENSFDVHGGVTFSGRGWRGSPLSRSLWWFGFDTAHCTDLTPGSLEMSREFKLGRTPGMGGVYRDIKYVRAECERLARQIALFSPEVRS